MSAASRRPAVVAGTAALATSEPQEQWTSEYLDELLDLKFERGPVAMSVSDYHVRLQSVADNIIAAITAERERRKPLATANLRLVEALETVVELYPHLTNLKDLLAQAKEEK